VQKVALITGVGPGTGSAIARRFHEGGYRVAALARDAERLRQLTNSLPGSLPVVCDVANVDSLHDVCEQIKQTLGPVDVLVHNAVRGTRGDILEIDPADLERNFRINVTSLVHLTRLLAPDMITKGAGAILVTGNTAPRQIVFCGVRSDKGGTTGIGRVDGSAPWSRRNTRCLFRRRRCDRRAVDAGGVCGQTG
jgi:NADP-dependent 3-hydroxy acid dehydrogenase YdfG